eukprot:TRINITY_DN17087_c0_g1_i1.p1 TRINITY_DN17087_c0_g1~~TRINITY_DN17087_c0_g1_i1.p1  ORF type:complete len:281 (-),score=28.28 TRINITY_DN17087_c0_g1_i1:56-871(-)
MLSGALLRPCLSQPRATLQFYSKFVAANTPTNSKWRNGSADPNLAGNVAQEVNSINSRLESLRITGSYLSGEVKLSSPLPNIQQTTIKLPTLIDKKIEAPRVPETKDKEIFIEDVKPEVKDPLKRSRMEEPVTRRIKKHAIRMVILRRKKMRKHQRGRLWDRMYLKFKAIRMGRRKRKELAFRNMLSEKISTARKFDAEKYVADYLDDFYTPITPGTYKGKRLPQWLILELMENDKQMAEEKKMEGKTYTTKETIVRKGETVDQFIQRTWK